MKVEDFKLSITGSFGAKDIGDEAMLTEDLHYVLDHVGIPRKNVFLFGWNRDYMSRYHNHPIENCFASGHLELAFDDKGWRKPKILSKRVKHRSRLKAIHEAVNASHASLVTGGGTINSRDAGGASVKRMYNMVRAFKTRNLPVFISGQTVGPLGLYADHDRMARYIVETVECLTVRDSHYSDRYLGLIQATPKELIQTFDDAYTLPYLEEVLPSDVESHLVDNNCIAVNVTDYTSDTADKQAFVAKLCERLVENYNTNIVLVSHSPRDLFVLWMIRDCIRNELKPRILVPDTREWQDKTIKKMISRCRCAIGGRYHFIVFAGTCDTPFVGMAGNHYSYIKQDGFARVLGQERYILTEKETWDEEVLWQRISERVDQRLNLSEKFERPSVSMNRFGKWLQDRFDLPVKDAA